MSAPDAAPDQSPAPEHQAASLKGLLGSREIIVACGPGGVGKTTTAAAAAAMAAWHNGGKVLVLTVDPARRLADALHLEGIGNRETRVPDEAFRKAGIAPRGELWAAMLDTKESWDALIRRHAPDERTRNEILSNPLYGQISSRFVQSHDYIAMERLYEIHAEGDYDLIVVDTPPTRNALDFLDAPERMAEFFSSRLLRWLIVPYRSRLVNFASRPFYQVADRILGTQFLEDISQFFILFQTMYNGFIERAQAVGRLLADRRTSFIVVTTLEAAPLHEGQVFIDELRRRDLHVGAVVLNKVLPAYLRDHSGHELARRLKDSSDDVAAKLRGDAALGGIDRAELAGVISEIGSSYLDYNLVAQREAEQRAELAHTPDVLVSVPYFESDVFDLSSLLRLGKKLWS
jgi:anion-transporting  ArsA/GET3 family ATPase